jgi:hypothetical protein
MDEDQQQGEQVATPVKKHSFKPEEIAAQFSDILKNVQELRSKNDRHGENALYLQVKDIFEQAYGEDLFKKAEEGAMQELTSEGFRILGKSTAFSKDNLERQAELFRDQQQTFGLQAGWQSISEAEKKSYQNEISLFVADTEKKRTELKRAGVNVSKEIFYNMIAGGYMFPDIKKSFISGKIKIPILLGEGAYKFSVVSKKEFENLIGALQTLFEMIVRQAVSERINNRFFGGKKRWRERKKRKIREILEQKIRSIDDEKKMNEMIELRIQNEVQQRIAQREKDFAQEVEGLKEEEAIKRLESIERSNKLADQQMKKEIEQVAKNLSKDIETIRQEEIKIKKIKKQQARKNQSLPKKSAYMKFVQGEISSDGKKLADSEKPSEPKEEKQEAPKEE